MVQQVSHRAARAGRAPARAAKRARLTETAPYRRTPRNHDR
ncbi:hypothetical protein P3T26_004660 [Streptomyces sp. MAA16]|nr:hypothetical protein [Streptomyces sp. MAA16]